MTDRLSVSEIEVHRFGGWTDRGITFPDHPLVVIHGPNETGKSTLAELLAWLVAGPAGTAADCQRFGDAGERIGGVLRGCLGPVPFESVGDFRVLKSGAPNDNGLTVHCGASHDAAAWRARLGGTDARVLSSIYRLWGEQLHHGAGAEEQLSKVALAALGGRTDPYELSSRLAEEARRWSGSRAAGWESVTALRGRLAELDEQLRDARSNAGEHASLSEQLHLLEEARAELHIAKIEMFERRRVAEAARDLFATRERISHRRADLQQIGAVPRGWNALAADPVAVGRAVHELIAATEAVARLEPALLERLRQLGTDQTAIAGVMVTDADLTAIARAVERLREADHDLVGTTRHHAVADAELAAARHRADQALAALPGVTSEQIRGALLGVTEQTQLGTAISRWSDATEQVKHRRATFDDVEIHRRTAAELRHQADAAWSRRDTGVTAERWLAGARDASPVLTADMGDRSGSGSWRATSRALAPWWVPAALLVVAALVVGAVHDWAIAGLLAALGVVVGLVSWPRSSPSTVDITRDRAHGQVDDHATDPALFDVATQLLTVTSDHEAAEIAGSQARAAVERAEAHAHGVATELHVLAAELGVELRASDPGAAAARLRAWVAASAAAAAEAQAARALAVADTRLDEAHRSIHTAEREVSGLLAGMGINVDVPLRAADDVVGAHRAAHLLWTDAERARGEHARSIRAYGALTAGLHHEISGWRPERVAEEAVRLGELASRRLDVQREIDSESSALEVRLGNDAALRTALESVTGVAALDVELERIGREIVECEQAIGTSSERIGELRNALSELAGVERIAALSLERGTTREAQEDAAVQAFTAALADQLLRSVAHEYERQHQPALIERTSELARSVAPEWDAVLVRQAAAGERLTMTVQQSGGNSLSVEQLSTGARALLYLALRVAMAEHDAQQRGVTLPLVCDDPLVHLDDQRAAQAMSVLASAAGLGHQVIVFTCHARTVEAAEAIGAGVVHL